MIIANVRVSRNKMVPCEVRDVFENRGRKLACVTALTGEPFTEWTHGGWCYSASARIPVELLSNIAIEVGDEIQIVELAGVKHESQI